MPVMPSAISLTNASDKMLFRSPNVVCPPDTVVPKVPQPSPVSASSSLPNSSRVHPGPFPFTSMNQAIHSNSREATTSTGTFSVPPPPYPGKSTQPPVTMSSPLLVNLLQNDVARSVVKTEPVENSCATTAGETLFQVTSVVKSVACPTPATFQSSSETKSLIPSSPTNASSFHLANKLSVKGKFPKNTKLLFFAC